MAVKITQLGESGTPARRYGSFVGRPLGGASHPVGRITQLIPTATPSRRYGDFSGRAPSGGHPVGRLTQLILSGTPGRRYGSFSGRASGSTGTGGFSRGLVVNNPMSEPLKLSTARTKAILLVDSADHVTGKTGLAGAMTIYASKDGGAAALITPAVTEISAANMPGHYSLALTTTHTNTLGDFACHIAAAGADPCDFILPVEVERTGLLGTAAVQAIWDALTSALTTVGSIGKWIVDKLDVVLSTRLATSGYTAPPTAVQNADAYLDRADAIEVGLTPRGAHRLEAAAAAGKLSGAATTTATIRNAVADSKNRIVATVDVDGNRTTVTTDVS